MKKIRAYSGRIAFLYILNLFIFGADIYAIITSFIINDTKSIIVLSLTAPFVFYSIFIGLKYLFNKTITINDDHIFVPNLVQDKYRQVQYETKIFFKDIVSADLISSFKNSKNKALRSIDSVTIKKYLEFVLLNGKKERIWLNGYTKKQITAFLNFLSTKVDFKLNVDEIMRYWYLTFGQYKKMKELRKKEGKPWE